VSVHCLGDRDVAGAEVPGEHNLGRSDRMLGCQCGHRRDVQVSTATQWAVCLNLDPMGATPCGQGGLLEGRVELDLIDGGHDCRLGQQGVQMVLQEVGHPNGPDIAPGIDLLQGPPGVDEQSLGRDRPMDEVQVNEVKAERLPAGFEGLRRGALLPVAQLGGDEELLAGDTGGGNRGSHT
jgi:hypothetical protein